MDVDRRMFSIGLIMALTAACETGAASRGKAVDSWWPQYRERFLDPSGRIIDTGNGGISHSEGQGYGMMLALLAGDSQSFASMSTWANSNLARSDMALYSWRYDPRAPNPVADPNNATDGDILIAWALALAGNAWKMKSYTDRSREIRKAIRKYCVTERHGRTLLLPGIEGFHEGDNVVMNPSYLIWPAFDVFSRLDGSDTWQTLISDGEDILSLAKFGVHRLPPDWLTITGHSEVAPAASHAPRFGFDAMRVPLYAVLGKRAALAQDIGTFWQQSLDRRQRIPAWIDVVTGEEANYAISSGGAAIASRLLGAPPPLSLSSDYFAASLQLLSKARL